MRPAPEPGWPVDDGGRGPTRAGTATVASRRTAPVGAGRRWRRSVRLSSAGAMIAAAAGAARVHAGGAGARQRRRPDAGDRPPGRPGPDPVRPGRAGAAAAAGDQRRWRTASGSSRSGAQGREAALAEARGGPTSWASWPARCRREGEGLTIRLVPGGRADPGVDGAGGGRGAARRRRRGDADRRRRRRAVRIVASTYFVDGDGRASWSTGSRLTGPYTITVIGPAGDDADGADDSRRGGRRRSRGDGGNVIVDERERGRGDRAARRRRAGVRPSGLLTGRRPVRRDEGRVVIPEDLRYTAEHEWVARRRQRTGAGRHHPLRAGRARRHRLRPAARARARRCRPASSFGEVESTKSVSEIYAPVTGTVVARNDAARRRARADQHRPVRRGLAGGDRRRPTRRRSTDLLDARGYRRADRARADAARVRLPVHFGAGSRVRLTRRFRAWLGSPVDR